MGKAKIGAVIALDGEREYNQAIKNITAELRTLKSEGKLIKEEFSGQSNSLKALQEKYKNLQGVLEKQKEKQKAIEAGLKNATQSYEAQQKNVAQLAKQYESANTKLEKMKKASGTTSKEMAQQEKVVKELSDALKAGEQNQQNWANRLQAWKTKLNTSKADIEKLNQEIKKNEGYIKEAEGAIDKCASSIDGYGKKTKIAVDTTLNWKEAVRGVVAGDIVGKLADSIEEVATNSYEMAKSMTATSNQIQASTGASSMAMQNYKEVLESVYENNYGDNLEDVANTMTIIKQNIGELDKADLQNVTEAAITLRDTFDMDISETIRGVNGLIKNMGVDATTAFNLVAKGAQNGLNKTDELGDNLAEYSQIWGQAGFSAEEMFAILENGLDAGAYNLDKVNDFVKEFTISLSDGRIEEGIENFSGETQTLFEQWQNGGATAAQVFHSVIDDLASMENQQEALTLASNTWSALGEDNAMKVITSLNDVNDSYDDVYGTMTDIQNIKYDDLSAQITQTARNIQMKVAEPVVKELLPKINDGLHLIDDNIELVSAAVIGLGSAIALNKMLATSGGQMAVKLLKCITTESLRTITTTGAQTAATKTLTLAQKGFNAVANMNPLGKIALAVTAAYAAYKLLNQIIVTNDEELMKNREEVKELCSEYDSLQDSIDSAVKQRKESIEDITTQYMGYQTMAEKLVELADKENKSSGEMALMNEYVNQMNEAMPNLNLAIDEQTGKLNLNADAIYSQIDALKEQAYYAAYQEKLTDILKNQADASLELAKIEQEKEDVKKKLAQLEDEYGEEISSTTQALMGSEEATYAAQSASVSYLMKQRELNKQLDDLSDREEEANGTIQDLNAEYENATDVMSQLGEQYGFASESAEDFADAGTDAASAATSSSDEVAEAMQKLKESVADSIQNSISMFEEFSGGTKISASEILKNLNSQIDGIQNWADNMKILANSAGQGMTEEFYQYLAEMGPESANLVQELVNTLNGDSGKFTEICDSWTEAMTLDEMADSIAEGFTSAKAEIESTSDDINNTLLEKWANMPTQGYQNGVYLAEGIARGINDGKSNVIKASEDVGAAANDAFRKKLQINSPSRVFTQNGMYISQGVARGITSAKAEAEDSVRDMCQSLVGTAQTELEIHSPSRKFKRDVGAQITKGIAFGITSENDTAVRNMRKTAQNLYTEAIKVISRQSAKRKVDKDALAVAKRQLNEAKELNKQADKLRKENLNAYSKSVYKTAQSWMTTYKQTHQVTLEDEKYFWKKVVSATSKGTEGYTKAFSKVESIEKYEKKVKEKLKNVFNVSEYTTGTNGEVQKKSVSEYYNDIYSAADTYLSNYSVLHNVSLQKEEYYWQQVVKKMKKGTQGYIDAMKQLKSVQSELKQEIAQNKESNRQYALSGGALETYETYYKVSAKAEIEYWDIVRKKFKSGTKERVEADQKYYEAKQTYTDKLKELNEEYYENVKEVNEKLEDEIQSLTDTYNDAVAERKDAIYSSFGLFDEFESSSASGQTLLYNLKTQVAGIADWEQQLKQLEKKGILSDGLMKELQEMGPEASASIHALNQLSAAELEEYNKLWEQKNALAESQAVKENETLRKETQSQIKELKKSAKEEIAAYKKEYQSAVKELNAAIEAPLKKLAKQATKIGEDTAASLVKAIKNGATKKSTTADLKKVNTKISSQLGKLERAGKTIGTNTLQGILDGLNDTKKINASAKSLIDALKKALQKEADIHSPSRLFKKAIGENIGDGIALGVDEKSETVSEAGENMIQSLLAKQKEEIDRQQNSLQAYAAEINRSAGIMELNNLISVAPVQQVTATVDNTELLGMFGQMLGMMQEYMPQIGNMQLVADTGALIGETSSGMSEAFAMAARRRR